MHQMHVSGTVRTYPLVSRAELLAGGLTRGAISRRVARGVLTRRYPGVYSYGPGDLSREAAWMAAVMACGAGAALSFVSAESNFDVSRWPDEAPHVTVPRRHRPVEGITIHTALGLDSRDVTTAREIPVTTTARMFVDLGTVRTAHQLCWVLNEAAFRRLFNRGATLRALDRAAGHPGRGTLKRALELYAMGSAGTKSRYEDLFLTLVEPEPLVNMTVCGYEVDFHWPDRRLVVEVDGNHSRPKDVRADDGRDASLAAAGYAVVRVTGKEVEALSRRPPPLRAIPSPTVPVPLRVR
jgi:hypothetical protein